MTNQMTLHLPCAVSSISMYVASSGVHALDNMAEWHEGWPRIQTVVDELRAVFITRINTGYVPSLSIRTRLHSAHTSHSTYT
jgi:hypothetical protein